MSLASAFACIYFSAGIRQVSTDYFFNAFQLHTEKKAACVHVQTHIDTHGKRVKSVYAILQYYQRRHVLCVLF